MFRRHGEVVVKVISKKGKQAALAKEEEERQKAMMSAGMRRNAIMSVGSAVLAGLGRRCGWARGQFRRDAWTGRDRVAPCRPPVDTSSALPILCRSDEPRTRRNRKDGALARLLVGRGPIRTRSLRSYLDRVLRMRPPRGS